MVSKPELETPKTFEKTFSWSCFQKKYHLKMKRMIRSLHGENVVAKTSFVSLRSKWISVFSEVEACHVSVVKDFIKLHSGTLFL